MGFSVEWCIMYCWLIVEFLTGYKLSRYLSVLKPAIINQSLYMLNYHTV